MKLTQLWTSGQIHNRFETKKYKCLIFHLIQISQFWFDQFFSYFVIFITTFCYLQLNQCDFAVIQLHFLSSFLSRSSEKESLLPRLQFIIYFCHIYFLSLSLLHIYIFVTESAAPDASPSFFPYHPAAEETTFRGSVLTTWVCVHKQ